MGRTRNRPNRKMRTKFKLTNCCLVCVCVCLYLPLCELCALFHKQIMHSLSHWLLRFLRYRSHSTNSHNLRAVFFFELHNTSGSTFISVKSLNELINGIHFKHFFSPRDSKVLRLIAHCLPHTHIVCDIRLFTISMHAKAKMKLSNIP